MSAKFFRGCLSILLSGGGLLMADDPVFKSDVALTRVDAQVVDREGRAITGLQQSDFVLRVNGKPVPIRNFTSENMPIDILLLLDVSGSMEPHVQRIAAAAQEALNVLAPKDRVAVMIFDTTAHVRLPFRSSHDDVTDALEKILRSESFHGGTRITSALVSAANYVAKEARPDARRAIVILTDDETQDSEDEPRVEGALAHANAILSFLQAPYEPPTLNGGGMPRRRGTWGGGGGGIGFPGGGIGFPGGGGGPIGFPGGRGRGGYGSADPSHTAGTATIAQDSGGDTMPVTQASALEDTLARLRQRYALHYYLPEGTSAAEGQRVSVELSEQARIRYDQAEIRYRRVFMSGGTTGERSGPMSVSRTSTAPATSSAEAEDSHSGSETDIPSSAGSRRKHTAVNEDSTPPVNTVEIDPSDSTSAPQAAPSQQQPSSSAPAKGGWPRANAGQQQQSSPPN